MGRTVQGRIEDMGAADEPRSYRVDDVTVIVERGTSARERYTHLYRLIALTDVLSIAVALLLAYWVRFGIEVPSGDFLLLLAGAPFAMLIVYGMFHLYDAYRYTAAEEFRRILLAVSLGVGGILALSFWSKGEFSRSWLALSWAFAIVAALASRRLWHAHIGHLKADGELSFPTLIVGTNAEAVHLSTLMERPSFGFRPLGMVATKTREGDLPDLPILGSVTDLREVIRQVGAECVFVAATALSIDEMKHVAKAVRLEGVEVRVTATLPEVLSSRVAVQSLGGVTALSLRPVRLTGYPGRAEAGLRHRCGRPRHAPALAVADHPGPGRQALHPRPGALPPAAGRSPWTSVHDAEVPHDARGRRRHGRFAARRARCPGPDVQAAG